MQANTSSETARVECISPDALQHFKTYKYSSVDKSPLSYYVLRHYVCLPSLSRFQAQTRRLMRTQVECLCRVASTMGTSQPRHIMGIFLRTRQRRLARTCGSRPTRAPSILGLLQLRLWRMGILYSRQHRRQAGTPYWHVIWSRRTFRPWH